MMNRSQRTLKRICITAIFLALNIVASSFSIPVPGGHLYLNDIVICTAAIILNPIEAFVVGGIGAFLGDFFFYPAPMFVSLVTHGIQSIVISLFSHVGKQKHPALLSGIGVFLGALLMVLGYSIGRAYIYSTPEYALIKLPYEFLQAGIGAVVGMLLCYKGKIRALFESHLQIGNNTKKDPK